MLKSNNQKLSLKGIELEASHGVYSSEKQSKSRFRVDVDLWADYQIAMKSDELSDTLDYQLVYNIVKEEMNQTANLIEHVVYRIMERIEQLKFPLTKIQVSIQKKDPPIDGFVESTQFEWTKELSSSK